MKSIPLTEQETTVTFIRAENTANVYTCDPTVMTKLDKLCKEHPDQFRLDRYDEYSKWYIVPKTAIKFHAKHPMTEEQLQRRRENAAKMNGKLK